MVACKTNTFDFGLLNNATLNNDLQFQPSRPLFTNKMNCFLLPTVPKTSKLLKSRISSGFVIFSSPTFTRILSSGIPSSDNTSSTTGLISSCTSATSAPKIAILGNRPSYSLPPYFSQKSLITALRNSLFFTLL